MVVLCVCRLWRSYLSTVAPLSMNGNNASMPRLLLHLQTHPQSIYLGARIRVTLYVVSGFLLLCCSSAVLCLYQILKILRNKDGYKNDFRHCYLPVTCYC